MAKWDSLIAAVEAVIYENTGNEISGDDLQSTLLSVINDVGKYATFKGVANPGTVPGVEDGPVMYLAGTVGTYANFGGARIPNSGVYVLVNNNDGTGWRLLPVFYYYGTGTGEAGEPVYVNVPAVYKSIAAMVADSANHTSGQVFLVNDITADPNIRAFYEYQAPQYVLRDEYGTSQAATVPEKILRVVDTSNVNFAQTVETGSSSTSNDTRTQTVPVGLFTTLASSAYISGVRLKLSAGANVGGRLFKLRVTNAMDFNSVWETPANILLASDPAVAVVNFIPGNFGDFNTAWASPSDLMIFEFIAVDGGAFPDIQVASGDTIPGGSLDGDIVPGSDMWLEVDVKTYADLNTEDTVLQAKDNSIEANKPIDLTKGTTLTNPSPDLVRLEVDSGGELFIKDTNGDFIEFGRKGLIQAANLAAIQALTGLTDRLYLALDTKLLYYWNGSFTPVTVGSGGGAGLPDAFGFAFDANLLSVTQLSGDRLQNAQKSICAGGQAGTVNEVQIFIEGFGGGIPATMQLYNVATGGNLFSAPIDINIPTSETQQIQQVITTVSTPNIVAAHAAYPAGGRFLVHTTAVGSTTGLEGGEVRLIPATT